MKTAAAEYYLIASAGSVDGIEKMINRFWFSDKYTVDRETLEIKHTEKPVQNGVRVRKLRGRYRFEGQKW